MSSVPWNMEILIEFWYRSKTLPKNSKNGPIRKPICQFFNFEHIKTESGAVSVEENVFLFGGFDQGSQGLESIGPGPTANSKAWTEPGPNKSRTNFGQAVPGSLVWTIIVEQTLAKIPLKELVWYYFPYDSGIIGPI